VTGPHTISHAPVACPACGKHGVWDPARQALACRSCGTIIDPAPATSGPVESFEFIPLLRDRPDSGRDWQPGATRVRCSTCGTSMDYPAYLAGRNCEGCGSPTLVACDATGAPVHPSAVAPFALTETDARDRVVDWLEKKRPIGSRRRGVIDTVRAVYLPCWMFTAQVRVPWRAERPKRNRDGEWEREPVDGVVELDWDGELAPGTASLPADLLERIEAASTADLRPYDPRYLAGYEVELYGINLWDAWDPIDTRMRGRVDWAVQRAAGLTSVGLETWPEWTAQRCRHVLVPVYAVEYTFAGERYLALVNGRSGTVAGRFAKDWIGIAIGVTVLLAVLAGIVLLAIQVLRWLF
jgi:hypothetical protein